MIILCFNEIHKVEGLVGSSHPLVQALLLFSNGDLHLTGDGEMMLTCLRLRDPQPPELSPNRDHAEGFEPATAVGFEPTTSGSASGRGRVVKGARSQIGTPKMQNTP